MVVFGCGYIGGEVARQAVANGAHVTALTRNLDTAASLRSVGIQTVVADLAGREWHDKIDGEVDYVLNAVSSGGGGKDGYVRSYFDGMNSMLDWANGAKPHTAVYTSSTSVYPQDGGVIVDEGAPTVGLGELPQVLLDTENLLREHCNRPPSGDRMQVAGARSFQRCFILRLAGIYGPDRRHLVDQVRSGTVSGLGDHHLNLAHRDDIVGAIFAAFSAPAGVDGGIFNVADDGAAKKETVVRWLAEQLGLPLPIFTGVPATGRRTVTPDRIISNGKLKTVLGWKAKYPTFREGYKNMLAPSSE